jgi:hypothetical protein
MSIEKNTPNRLKKYGFGFSTFLNSTMDLIPDDGALGIYIYLGSKSEDWDIQEKDIMRRFKKGRDYVRAKMRILKDLGLVKTIAYRDDSGRIVAWDTCLFSQIPENPSSGDSSRFLKNQNVAEPESGKPTHILNKEKELKIKERKKTNKEQPVVVFSCKETIKTHVENTTNKRDDYVEDEIIDQIAFYAAKDIGKDSEVKKKVNIGLKLLKEGKWLIPQGWNGITSQSIIEKDEEYARSKQLQYQQEARAMKNIKELMVSKAGELALQEMLKKVRINAAC